MLCIITFIGSDVPIKINLTYLHNFKNLASAKILTPLLQKKARGRERKKESNKVNEI